MDITNGTAPRETPMEMLRRLLPTVGFSASLDSPRVFNALLKPGMKNRDLKVAITAWVARMEQKMMEAR